MEKRDNAVDLFRAFGIILMIMGHIGFGYLFDKWIHIFHMPMFFIISGYFYKPNSLKNIMKRRLVTLIIPYLFWGIFSYFLSLIFEGSISKKEVLLFVWNTRELGIPIAGALWFLTALFFCYAIYYTIWNFSLTDKYKNIITILVSLLGVTINNIIGGRLPFAIDTAMVGVGLFHIGRLIDKHFFENRKMRFIIISIIGIILFSGLGLINGYVNMRTGEYGVWGLFYINAIGLTISFLLFFKCICSKTNNKLYEYLSYIGKNSISFLCLNQLLILLNVMLIKNINDNYCLKLILLVIVTIEIYFIDKIISKTRLKKLLGKS